MSDAGDERSQTQPLPLTAAVDPLIGREVGGYVIEGTIGEGGMGLVYRARHPFLNRKFAIKVLRPEFAADDEFSGNFVREAQTLSGLKHPNIIDIVGFGPLDAQRQYMVMEFLEGRTLQEELDEVGRLDVARALDVVDPVLDALEAAHSIDVIHRDLKPSNVFLARVSGGTEVVKLLDFGLAKFQPQVLAGLGLATPTGAPTERSTMAGTPEYIAPEQARGQPASKLSDLYSFGVMLFELLTGEQPFAAAADEHDRIYSLLRRHQQEPAPPLSNPLVGDFPAALELLVAELLEKAPERRPQSALAVRQRLARIRRGYQQHETRQVMNPLLQAPGLEAALTGAATPALPAAAEPADLPELTLAKPPRRAWPALVVAAALALVAAVGWWMASPGAPAAAVKPPPAPAEPLPTPSLAAPPAPAPPAASPAPAATVDDAGDELAPLPKGTAPSAGPTKKPAPRATVEIVKSTCEPTERWRAATRAHLQELQQAAAASEDPTSWPRFERAEAQLTSAIAAAETGVACEAVERQIQTLAKELTR